MQLHEKKGKHGAPVTCGDWLFDNRLGLASGLRVRSPTPTPLAPSRPPPGPRFLSPQPCLPLPFFSPRPPLSHTHRTSR